MSLTAEQAEKERADLIGRYISSGNYSEQQSEADGVNHLAFIATDLDKTIDFYSRIVRLRLLRVRTMDGDPTSTQVFFDMGRGELLAFLRLSEVNNAAQIGKGGFHHFALTITRAQYDEVKQRLESEAIPYTTISHEILDTITTTDPNGITLELSVWKIDPKDMKM